MTVTIGEQFGHYEILRPLGAGGMGEVWCARDTRLNRYVAIKVLPSSFANDEDRLRRFEQEALATSALNHPNILTVHDFGTHEDSPYIVAELLEGEELRDHLNEGAMTLRKAIDYAQQIANGLAAAHAKSIVHRDLKPENIFITTDGRVKILDFGLAKLRPQSVTVGSGSDVQTQRAITDPGTIMGTVGYMSPEQVRGREADHRSDIFSLGVILYEMLSGQRAFSGESMAETMTAIVKEEPPDLAEVNSKVPPQLARIVHRCLEKKPERRFHSAHDLAFALEALSTPSSSSGSNLPASGAIAGEKATDVWRRRIPWIIATGALLAVLGLIFFTAFNPSRETRSSAAVRFGITAPDRTSSLLSPEISPDGRNLVYAALIDGKASLWQRSLDALTAQQIPGADNVANPHFFSPDSRSIVFPAQGTLKRLDLGGGPPKTLCALPPGPGVGSGGGAWNRDGVILFTSAGRIYRVASTGGDPELVLGAEQPEQDAYYRWPCFLPDGRHFVYLKTSVQQGIGSSAIFVASLDSTVTDRLIAADSHALYTAAGGGHLIYARDDTLVAQSFDAGALKLTGEAFAIADTVTVTNAGRGLFSISDDGILVLEPSGNLGVQQPTWVDRTGKLLEQLGSAGQYAIARENQRLSPDGKQIAVARQDPKTKTRDIYVIDIARGTTSRLTYDPGEDLYPVWSPDSSRIAWASDREGVLAIYQKLASGVGNDELLFRSDAPVGPDSWSPDGRFILIDRSDPKTKGDLWVLGINGGQAQVFLQTTFNERHARFSPNGRYIMYVSDDQGRNEVYVQTYPASSGKWQISNNGGVSPTWSSDGHEIFYVSPEGKLMSVDVRLENSFEAGVPKPLFDFTPLRARGWGGPSYAASLDGQRFLVNREIDAPVSLQYVVTLNWPADLKR